MATYKQPCIHCGQLIERDSHLCPMCGSRTPFIYSCPSCLREIPKNGVVCGGCGRKLMVPCPFCKAETSAGGSKCSGCGKSLMIKCQNKRCGQAQFFENNKCTVCGKPIKKKQYM